MPAQRLLRSRIGDDPRWVEAQELLIGERGPAAQTRFCRNIDEACRDQHVVEAGARGSAVETVAVNPDVEAALLFRLGGACGHFGQLPLELVG